MLEFYFLNLQIYIYQQKIQILLILSYHIDGDVYYYLRWFPYWTEILKTIPFTAVTHFDSLANFLNPHLFRPILFYWINNSDT